MKRFFVYCLLPADRRYGSGDHYEVQILDDEGRAAQIGHFTDPTSPLVIDGMVVPHAVLRVALRQAQGQGDYVNEYGQTISPF